MDMEMDMDMDMAVNGVFGRKKMKEASKPKWIAVRGILGH